MIPELGQFALALALIAAIVQSVLPIVGAARRNTLWMASAQATAVTQAALLIFAFGALMHSFVVSDFQRLHRAQRGGELAFPQAHALQGRGDMGQP